MMKSIAEVLTQDTHKGRVNNEMDGGEIGGKPELLTLDDDTYLGEFSDG